MKSKIAVIPKFGNWFTITEVPISETTKLRQYCLFWGKKVTKISDLTFKNFSAHRNSQL